MRASSTETSLLTETQISLAHFCEIHGPTSILCTQLASVACNTNPPCETPQSEDLFKADYWDSNATTNTASEQQKLSSPFESPPNSPRSPNGGHNPYFPRIPADIHRYNADTDYDEGCDNCTFLVPKGMSERLPDGAPGSPRPGGKGRHGTPVLRSTQSILVSGSPCHTSHSCSPDDSGSDTHSMRESRNTIRFAPPPQVTASPPSEDGDDDAANESAISSPLSDRPPQLHNGHNAHTHSLTYVSTRHPTRGDLYSLLRRACIRTLSSENLPRGSPGGPILFGDPVAGYTIAYIFRLPDPRARGKRRTYALIALGGRDSWRVTRAYVEVTRAFESIAGVIGNLAESVLERESLASDGSGGSRPGTASSSFSVGAQTPTLSSSAPGPHIPPATPVSATAAHPLSISTQLPHPRSAGSQSATTSPVSSHNPRITPVSSFLSAKKVDPDGYPRVSRDVMRAKGLAEIVGKDDFFVELHAKFCLILSGLVVGGPSG